jgi:hypothetical protein
MAKGSKGDPSAPPQTPAKKEPWENIDESWEGLETAARRAPDSMSGLPTLDLDREVSGVTPATTGPLDKCQTDAEDQPFESDARWLPVAPPGHRRVAKTIMGLGAPDLQSLLQAEQAVRGEPASRRGSSDVQIRTTPLPETAATLLSPPEEKTPVRQPRQDAIEATTHVASRPPPPPSPVHAEVALSGRTDPLPAVEARTDPLLSMLAAPDPTPLPGAEARTDPLLSRLAAPDPTPPVPSALETRAEEHPSAVPTLRPDALVPRPPPAASRYRPPETSRVDHGPSNLTLVILWMVALASVGLAIFLYATR